jgi:hypothetical protein
MQGLSETACESCVEKYPRIGFVTSTGCQSQSDSHSLVELGAVFNYLWGSVFAGGEMRLVIVNDSAFVLGAHLGYML